MTQPSDEDLEKILSAVYLHGVREGDDCGCRSVGVLPDDEMTIFTALDKLTSERARSKERVKRLVSPIEESLRINTGVVASGNCRTMLVTTQILDALEQDRAEYPEDYDE